MDSPRYDRSRSHSPVDSRRRDRSYSRSRSRSVDRSMRRRRSRSGSENGYDYRRRSRSPGSSRRRGSVERENPKPSHCIGIFGLSIYTTEKQLEEIFEEYGDIQKVQVILDAQTGKSRGFAFIYYDSVKSATRAKDDCNGTEIDGRRIRVDYSITSRPHTPTPGIYMGKPTYSNRNNRGYGGGRSGYRDRYRSPSPNYRGGRRDYGSGSRGYDRDDYGGGRYDRDRYGGGGRYDRPHRNDRYDRSRSNSPRRYRY